MKEQSDKVEYKFSSDWIKRLEDENHWRLYWQQQKLMENHWKAKDCMLEIGVGTGFTANYLRSKGVNVTTMDIDKDKHPDVTANIVEYNWENSAFDHILAFEVFEHIPFEEFEKLLQKLRKVVGQYIFMSVPLNERVWFHAEIRLPVLKNRTIHIATRKNKIDTEHHFWELNFDKYSIGYIKKAFDEAGFEIVDSSRKLSRLFLRVGHKQ